MELEGRFAAERRPAREDKRSLRMLEVKAAIAYRRSAAGNDRFLRGRHDTHDRHI
jgi:hypothetical protein